MRFIHTSDWHIGRLFQNISLLEDQLHILQQIQAYAKEYSVDALVIAGDIYDRSVPPADAVDALNTFLTAFRRELSIPVIMISGNHDSSERLGFGAQHMQESGLHILSDIREVNKPVVIESKDGPVHVYGIPYHDPVEVREAYDCEVKSYDDAHTYLASMALKARTPEVPAVLISHCFIDGAEACDSERRLSVGGADSVSYQPLTDFNYVALGHLHGPQHKGAKHIRYSGSPLKYSFSEHKQKKGVTLVEITKDSTTWEHLDLIPLRDMRVLEGSLAEIIENGKTDAHKDDYIFARLTDTEDLLDPMGQLRKAYPNTLELERKNFAVSSGSRLVADVSNKRSEDQVFKEFFVQVMGDELTDEQNALLLETINEAQTQLEGKA
tara:strand:- start:10322 stop:11467 length:1146 start_codon:yes stop_codon:yes gene_type:complete